MPPPRLPIPREDPDDRSRSPRPDSYRTPGSVDEPATKRDLADSFHDLAEAQMSAAKPADAAKSYLTLPNVVALAVAMLTGGITIGGSLAKFGSLESSIATIREEMAAGKARGVDKANQLAAHDRQILILQQQIAAASAAREADARAVQVLSAKLDGFGDLLLVVCQGLRPSIQCTTHR